MGISVGDLGEKYFTECLGLPASVLAGCGLVSNMLYPPKRAELDKYFDEVKTNEMCAGDVCIWEYGHIAIFDHWDGKSSWWFSQNPNPCQVMVINAGGLHAFRLKGSKPAPVPKERYLNLKPTVNSWTVYKTNNSYVPTGNDVAGKLNPQKYNGLSYKILEDKGNYHFKIHTSYYGDVYIAGNPNKYSCTITDAPTYPYGSY